MFFPSCLFTFPVHETHRETNGIKHCLQGIRAFKLISLETNLDLTKKAGYSESCFSTKLMVL